MSGSDAERERGRRDAVLRRHGRTSTANVALGAQLPVWWPAEPDPDAFVAYADVPGAMVAAGEPVAAEDRLVAVAEAFVAHASERGRRVSFFATEGRLAASPALQRRLLGEQPVWDPRRWSAHVATHRSLREQLRRARAKEVRIRSVSTVEMHSTAMRQAIDVLLTRWRATRSMAPMRFLVEIDLASGAEFRRQFVAEQHGQLVALLSLVQVPAREGWLFEHLLRDPDAPNGTLELLVDHVMCELANEGVPWATLGLAPLHGNVQGSWRWLRRWSSALFNFEGLAAFKRKLRPERWEPIYLAWPVGQRGSRALLDGLRAFAGGSLWRFGVRTVLRGPTPLLRALELLLVPWTIVLALAPSSDWFPSVGVHAGWVAFDGALLLLLHVLLHLVRTGQGTARHGRRRVASLATIAAVAVTADAVLTLLQALWWNVPELRAASGASMHDPMVGGLARWLIVAVACAGPLLAAPVLWGAAMRLRALSTARPSIS